MSLPYPLSFDRVREILSLGFSPWCGWLVFRTIRVKVGSWTCAWVSAILEWPNTWDNSGITCSFVLVLIRVRSIAISRKNLPFQPVSARLYILDMVGVTGSIPVAPTIHKLLVLILGHIP